MKRRKFIKSTISASALPLTFSYSDPHKIDLQKELYEIRTYEFKFGGNQNALKEYLSEILHPTLKRIGVNHFQLFSELGNSDPKKLWVLISYPNMAVYLMAQNLHSDGQFIESSKKYNSIAPDKTIYNRIESALFLAFDGMPKMMKPIDGASLFELRTYEGYSEDAVRRKIKMFDTEEIQLFLKTNLHPVFFGEMIIGPYRPCLTYMLNFKDMKEREASWQSFVDHAEWKAMKIKPEYANSVSNIRKSFLESII